MNQRAAAQASGSRCLRARVAPRPLGVLAIIIACLLQPTSVLAREPSDLDPSFSDDGVRYIDFGRAESASDLFVDAAGRLTVVGFRGRSEPYQDAMTRLLPDGRLDRTFGDDGKVILELPGLDTVTAWDSTPDDRLVAFGGLGADGYYLIRFNADGHIDKTFADGGMASGRFGAGSFLGNMLIVPSGRMFVLATVDGDTVIKAHKPNGARDLSFGRQGIARLNGESYELIYHPDGRILVAGVRNNRRLVIDALRLDGRRDATFGVNGRSSIAFGAAPGDDIGVPHGVIASDGDVVVATDVRSGLSAADLLVARFDADGRPALSFGGGDGWRRVDIGPIDQETAVAALPGGKVVVGGFVLQDFFGHTNSQMFLVGLRADGSKWRAFGDDGVVRSDFGLERNVLLFDAVFTDGSLVVAGEAKNDFMVARFRIH